MGLLAINIALAFSLPLASQLSDLLDSPIGQPMAAIFFNSFGKRGTLAIWAVVVIVQCVELLILNPSVF